MGDFKMNYPTVGTSALKASADPIAHATAVIVEFPGGTNTVTQPNCSYSLARNTTSHAQGPALGNYARNLGYKAYSHVSSRCTKLEGKALDGVSKLEEIIAVAVISSILIAGAIVSI